MSSYRPGGPGAGSGLGGRGASAPRGYVPGLGRGAAGFTTRSDIGPMAARTTGVGGAESGDSSALISSGVGGSGSRAAELRAAKLQMKAMQQKQQQTAVPVGVGVAAAAAAPFGVAPKGYVPGAGRGAGTKSGDDDDAGPTGYDQFGGYNDNLFGKDSTPYDDDDEEADRIYDAVDERMSARSSIKRRRGAGGEDSITIRGGDDDAGRSRIGDQFRELKEKLADVTEDEWAAIPEVGDYSLKYKQKRREDTFTPLTDSLLEARKQANADATSGNTKLAGTAQAVDGTSTSGFRSVVTNMSGLAEARGTVLGMSLDKMSDSVTGQTVVDPKGYLTSLSKTKIATNAEVSDVHKARLLLKSVRDTNPKHAPGWIAAARVEEAAGKTLQARKVIQEGCEACPDSEDVWLEAASLHPPEVAKTILATAVRRLPKSVNIFLRAADLEHNDSAKKAVLRKALESNPTSVTLWKAAIELEDADDARILLSVAVENVPHSVEMWLALARLETYENARRVLNRARKALPAERAVWIAASKLEESQGHDDMVDKIIDKAVRSLAQHDALVSRAQWLKEAETAESAGAPLTAGSIARRTVGMGVVRVLSIPFYLLCPIMNSMHAHLMFPPIPPENNPNTIFINTITLHPNAQTTRTGKEHGQMTQLAPYLVVLLPQRVPYLRTVLLRFHQNARSGFRQWNLKELVEHLHHLMRFLQQQANGCQELRYSGWCVPRRSGWRVKLMRQGRY